MKDLIEEKEMITTFLSLTLDMVRASDEVTRDSRLFADLVPASEE